MKIENQSRSDERISNWNEQYAAILEVVAELRNEIAELRIENLEHMNETIKCFNETTKWLSELTKWLNETAKWCNEIAKWSIETVKWCNETTKWFKETDKWSKATENLIEENGKQIGSLDNKFGGCPEAMERPSIRRILEERFDADYLGAIRFRKSKDSVALEVDAWGVSRNDTSVAYIVETKSKFREEHIEQVWQLVERFRSYRSVYREKRVVYPMLAAVEISEEQRRKVWAAGIYLIDINDGVFRYAEPPQDFEANGYHGVRRVQRSVPYLQLIDGGVGNPRRAE